MANRIPNEIIEEFFRKLHALLDEHKVTIDVDNWPEIGADVQFTMMDEDRQIHIIKE